MVTWDAKGPRTLADTDVYTFASEKVGDTLQVTVAKPPFADAMADPIPVLYVLDPVATLDVVIGVTRSLSLLAFGAFPPLLVVGVGYDADPLTVMSLRFRDLTPTDAPLPTDVPSAQPMHGLGGAGAFLDALATEVMPFVEEHHRASPTDRTIVGWSLGGLFGLHALYTHPEIFRRYLLVSPSIWWDDAYGLRVEADTAAARTELEAQLYLAVGEREETAGSRSWPIALPAEVVETSRMVSNTVALGRRLRSRGTKGLDVDVEVLPSEHHTSIFPTALSRGLLHLFGPGL